VIVPDRLSAACRLMPERSAWLTQLTDTLKQVQAKWSLTLADPIHDASCAWVAPAVRANGPHVILKIAMPHMEAAHEIQGLRFWNGDGIVRLLQADEDLNAMLLERCEPGTPLREMPEPEQDVLIAGVLRRLWRKPSEPHPFRPLSFMLEQWALETRATAAQWLDSGLVHDGLRLFEELSRTAKDDVLLATDLHAGNVLRAQREEWLAIDPKPFVGDRAYDATQHLLNCRGRLTAAPTSTIRRYADLLEVHDDRVRLWTFARVAAEPRADWNDESLELAKALASDASL
jgi:streptomycin 6-kinase